MSRAARVWVQQLDLVAYADALEAEENETRAKMTAAQLRDYRIFQREIAERCPKCGKRDVELEQHSEPDMVGETYWTEFKCCGYTDEPRNTHCEYDASGRIVDVG